ncbi:MAG: 2-oxoacid:acceptor oxidoreductase subunit alpha [bacterium]|nr:2-oxoacid:acceptor oxidoreductase subunit alpha [bacterium]
MVTSITWKIGGEAGFGIISSGTMLARSLTRAGYIILATNEYPSLIRGGHNLVSIRISTEKFSAMRKGVDILIALNKETVMLHKEELSKGALIVYDPNAFDPSELSLPSSIKSIPVPFSQEVKNRNGEPIMRNTVALGASARLLGLEFSSIQSVIEDQFKKKGEETVRNNVAMAKAGFDYVYAHFPNETSFFLSPPVSKEKQLVVNASEAVGLGAVRAGLKFAAIYPMTPINALITFLADHAKRLGIVYKQPEDEIAGINMAIGASVAGVRSMVATSGGGFALMAEGLSLTGIIEVPLVIDLGMRVGPATGMPTWTEQGELLFAIRAGHGEFPRIVLAPADAAEAYSMTIDAFNLADRYQVPVILLTDKYINESLWCVPFSHFQNDVSIDRGKLLNPGALDSVSSFARYEVNAEDGVSARSVPGMKNGQYYANSYEHDEFGHVTEDPGKRKAMAEKRLRKFITISKNTTPPTLYGQKSADMTFVTWGSTRGPVLEALEMSDYLMRGSSANLLHFSWMYPFPREATIDALKNAKRIIIVEQNATSQFASLLREHTGIEATDEINKYDGRPLYPDEIIERITKS